MIEKVFATFCILLAGIGIYYQTALLSNSKDLNKWYEFTARTDFQNHFKKLGVYLEATPTGSFGNIVSGKVDACQFKIIGADLSGGTTDYVSTFLSGSQKIAYYYRGALEPVAPVRRAMILSQIDSVGVSIGLLPEIRPMYAIIYEGGCSDEQVSLLFMIGI